MAICEVLRCQRTAEQLVELGEPDGMVAQVAICGEHHRQMQAGVRHRWEPNPAGAATGSLLMGADLDAAAHTVVGIRGTEEHAFVLAPDGTDAITVLLTELTADGVEVPLRLLMSDTVLHEMRRFLCSETWFDPAQ
ncbi:hypothetical protein [Geodermatophilus sp. URMC 63]